MWNNMCLDAWEMRIIEIITIVLNSSKVLRPLFHFPTVSKDQ